MSYSVTSYIDLVDKRHIIIRVFDSVRGFSADNVHCANADEASVLLENLRQRARKAGLTEEQQAPTSFMYDAGLSLRELFAGQVGYRN
jgi:hypothetical protein